VSIKAPTGVHDDGARCANTSVARQQSFYADLYPLVSRVVRSTLGSDADQDDVLQTALLSIFRSIDSVREPSRLEGWVAAVAANTARHEIRARRRRRRLLKAISEDSPLTSYEPDFDNVLRQAGTKHVLARMSCREREVLTLWLSGAGTLDQIAHRLGCSLSTARRRLGRARRALTRTAA
jgi:RNA polymerase sigma-70 factor (ECF subfamily)